MSLDTRHTSTAIKGLWLLLLWLCGLAVGAALTAWCNSAPTDIVSLKWQQLCQSLLIFALPAIVFRHTATTRATADIGWPRHSRIWIAALLLMPCAIPAINLTKWLNDMMVLPACMSAIEQAMLQMEQQAEALTTAFLDVADVQGLMLNLLALAFVPPFGRPHSSSAPYIFSSTDLYRAFCWEPHLAISIGTAARYGQVSLHTL